MLNSRWHQQEGNRAGEERAPAQPPHRLRRLEIYRTRLPVLVRRSFIGQTLVRRGRVLARPVEGAAFEP